MTDQRTDAPLGKSVEEIERDSGNLVNDPRQGEARRHEDAAVIPAVANANTSTVMAVVRPGDLIEPGSGADDGTAQTQRDSSEES